jgi:hypothetical protein
MLERTQLGTDDHQQHCDIYIMALRHETLLPAAGEE